MSRPTPGQLGPGVTYERLAVCDALPEKDDRVWLLVVTGVYDQGVVAAYRDLERAKQAAAEFLAGSDGYHDVEVRPVTLDVDPDRDEWGVLMLYGSPKRGNGEVVVRGEES